MANTKHSHFAYLDGLRAVAIVGVVGIHALSNIVNQADYVSWNWQLASLLNLSLRWAVPVFIMISGALLLPKDQESNKVFVTKRLQKLMIPFGVFLVLYFLWFNRLGPAVSIQEYSERVLIWGNPYYHMYFMYAIFGLYLLTPALRLVVKGMSDRALGLFIILILGMSTYWSMSISWYSQTFPRDTLLAVTHFLPYVGYYLLGYFLHERWQIQRYTFLGVATFISVWLAMVLTTQWYSLWGYSARSMMLEDYASINVVLFSMLIFVGMKWWYEKRGIEQNRKWMTSLAAAALGIYLIHVMVLEEVVKWLRGLGQGDWVVVLGAFGLSLGVAWGVTELMGTVPGLRKVVGR